MASQRIDVIVARPSFTFTAVAVGLESFPLSASERSAPQKRGMKNIKVPRRLKTFAKTWVCAEPARLIHAKGLGHIC